MAKALEALGEEVCLLPPFGQVAWDGGPIKTWLTRRAWFYPKDPSLMIFDMHFFPHFAGSPRVGFAVFETDGFTPIQLAALNSVDLLVTPSEWGKQVLEHHKVKPPVRVVPEGYNPEVFTFPNQRTTPGGPVRFIHVGKFEERKGTLQTIRCFARALEREDAELRMHIHNPFLSDYSPVEKLMKELGFVSHDGSSWRRLGLKVEFTRPVNDPEELARMYREADCGIFPSKGEAWGLCQLECLASGTPIVSGRWTGMAEYLPTDYPSGFILGDSKLETADDGVWYYGDRGRWHVVPDEELEAKIKAAYEVSREVKRSEKWLAVVRGIRESLTWERAASRLMEVMKEFKG